MLLLGADVEIGSDHWHGISHAVIVFCCQKIFPTVVFIGQDMHYHVGQDICTICHTFCHPFNTLYDNCAHFTIHSGHFTRYAACWEALELCETAQVPYVIPVSSILGRLSLVPVGTTRAMPFDMQRESLDIPGAVRDKRKRQPRRL
jgi:hypothetical protein